MSEDTGPSRAFWPCAVMGCLLGAVGVASLATARDVPVVRFGAWLVGLALVHDLLLVPVVAIAGVALGRVPVSVRSAVVRWAIVCGIVVLFSWPFTAGWGQLPSNPSILPRDYRDGLLLVLGIVTSGAVVSGVVSRLRRGTELAEDRRHV